MRYFCVLIRADNRTRDARYTHLYGHKYPSLAYVNARQDIKRKHKSVPYARVFWNRNYCVNKKIVALYSLDRVFISALINLYRAYTRLYTIP